MITITAETGEEEATVIAALADGTLHEALFPHRVVYRDAHTSGEGGQI